MNDFYLILIFIFDKIKNRKVEVPRMASGKGFFINALGGLVLRQGRVTLAREVSPRFRWIEVQADALRELEWTPGDKVQVLFPSLDMRTYTPLAWNRQKGTTEFLLYRNQPPDQSSAAEHPGTHWIRTLKEGDPCRFVGPQRSLAVAADAPVVLFGDETSFAVALALRSAATTTPACVFEVNSRSEATAVLAELGLPGAVCVERTADDSHLAQVGAELESLLTGRAAARLLMTGRAQSIQALQSRRRAEGKSRPHKTKAYWSAGKAGLD